MLGTAHPSRHRQTNKDDNDKYTESVSSAAGVVILLARHMTSPDMSDPGSHGCDCNWKSLCVPFSLLLFIYVHVARRLRWVGHILHLKHERLIKQTLKIIFDIPFDNRQDGDILMDVDMHSGLDWAATSGCGQRRMEIQARLKCWNWPRKGRRAKTKRTKMQYEKRMHQLGPDSKVHLLPVNNKKWQGNWTTT